MPLSFSQVKVFDCISWLENILNLLFQFLFLVVLLCLLLVAMQAVIVIVELLVAKLIQDSACVAHVVVLWPNTEPLLLTAQRNGPVVKWPIGIQRWLISVLVNKRRVCFGVFSVLLCNLRYFNVVHPFLNFAKLRQGQPFLLLALKLLLNFTLNQILIHYGWSMAQVLWVNPRLDLLCKLDSWLPSMLVHRRRPWISNGHSLIGEPHIWCIGLMLVERG